VIALIGVFRQEIRTFLVRTNVACSWKNAPPYVYDLEEFEEGSPPIPMKFLRIRVSNQGPTTLKNVRFGKQSVTKLMGSNLTHLDTSGNTVT